MTWIKRQATFGSGQVMAANIREVLPAMQALAVI